jgi:hypothetical protein
MVVPARFGVEPCLGRRMRRAAITFLALALVALGTAAVATAHFQRYPTSVTIKLKGGAKNSTQPDVFQGNVNSTLARCTRGRTVIVSRDGAFVGQTLSASDGSWSLPIGGQAAAGNYTATALRKVYRRHRPGHRRHKHVCLPDASKALKVKASGVYTQ